MIQFRFIALVIIVLSIYSCGNTESSDANSKEGSATKDTTAIEHTDTVITSQPKKLLSPRKIARDNTVVGEIEVDYGAPSVRGRVVWGELVPYDTLWRAGANETTAITFEKAVSIGGVTLESGTYSYFIVPSKEDKWTIIINTKWHKDKHDMWGTYGYDEANDVVRVKVEPNWREDAIEVLNYSVEQDGSIIMHWEKVSLSLPVSVASE